MRLLTGSLLVIGGLFMVPAVGGASPVLLCEYADGHLSVTQFVTPDPVEQAKALQALRGSGHLPGPGACWTADTSILPPRSRPDPRHPGQEITQRHRWRRGAGNTVVVDPTVKEPHARQIRAAVGTLFAPGRHAQLLVTPLGLALDRALEKGDWLIVQALLTQAESLTGPNQVLTPAEIAALRGILADYEAD